MSTNSRALEKRSSQSALILPPSPPAPKRVKRPATVLDEDTYTSELSDIIKQQFFPGLVEGEAWQELQDAKKCGNSAWIAEAEKKLKDVSVGIAPKMSLGKFQELFTSEDNESMYKLLDKANKERFEKRSWVYDGNMYASKQRIAQQKVIKARAKAEEDSRGNKKEVVLRPSQDLDQRPAAPTTAKYAPFNTLMFHPDGVEGTLETLSQKAEGASNAPPKAILYHNTRLPPKSEPTPLKDPPSPTLSAVRDAIAGHPRYSESDAGFLGEENCFVEGYEFVGSETTSNGSAANTFTPFHIREAGDREKMHLKMVDKIKSERSGKSQSNQTSGAMGPPSQIPKFTSYTPALRPGATPGTTGGKKKAGSLTPAAQVLLQKMRTPARQRGSALANGPFGDKTGGDWTPLSTPKRRKK